MGKKKKMDLLVICATEDTCLLARRVSGTAAVAHGEFSALTLQLAAVSPGTGVASWGEWAAMKTLRSAKWLGREMN